MSSHYWWHQVLHHFSGSSSLQPLIRIDVKDPIRSTLHLPRNSPKEWGFNRGRCRENEIKNSAGRPFGRSFLSRRWKRRWKVSPRNTAKNRKFFRPRRRLWVLAWNHCWLGKTDFIRLGIRLSFLLCISIYSLFQVLKLFGKNILSSNLTSESQLPDCQLIIVIFQHPLLSWRTGTFSLMDGNVLLYFRIRDFWGQLFLCYLVAVVCKNVLEESHKISVFGWVNYSACFLGVSILYIFGYEDSYKNPSKNWTLPMVVTRFLLSWKVKCQISRDLRATGDVARVATSLQLLSTRERREFQHRAWIPQFGTQLERCIFARS